MKVKGKGKRKVRVKVRVRVTGGSNRREHEHDYDQEHGVICLNRDGARQCVDGRAEGAARSVAEGD